MRGHSAFTWAITMLALPFCWLAWSSWLASSFSRLPIFDRWSCLCSGLPSVALLLADHVKDGAHGAVAEACWQESEYEQQ